MQNSFYKIIHFFLGVVIVFGGMWLFNQPSDVIADSNDTTDGYAWSSNIGWISFNCTNEGTCATSDYGVDIDSNGALSGYAWSSNVGWLSFNETTGCPSGSCAPSVSDGALSGWAKFIVGDDFADGWDGWVSLSGANYGVTVDGNGDLHGYAWGDDVVGWVSFNCADAGTCGTSSYKVSSTQTSVIPTEISGATGSAANELCDNNLDDDSDGLIDCADTLDCSAFAACGGTETQCFDTIDNDGDSAVDCSDSDCTLICFPPSFSLVSSGDILATFVGQEASVDSTSVTITVEPDNNFSDAVSFSVSDWNGISGGTANFSPALLSSGEYESGTLFYVTIPNTVNAGTYNLTIQGSGGGLTRTVSIDLSVSVVNPSFEEI